MGDPYFISLIFKEEDVWDVFDSVNEMSRKMVNKNMTLDTDNDQWERKTFSKDFKNKMKAFSKTNDEINFDTLLNITLDEEINSYDWRDYIISLDDKNRVSISIELVISVGRNFARYKFMAPVSSIGILLLTSMDLRKQFVDLMVKHNGLLGTIKSIASDSELVFWQHGVETDFLRPIGLYDYPDNFEDE